MLNKTKQNHKFVGLVMFLCVLFFGLIGSTSHTNAKNVNQSITLGKGMTYTVEQTVSKKATYKTTNKRIAIAKNGKITAKNLGTAKITIKDGKNTYVYKVTVAKIYLSKQNVTVNEKKTTTLKVSGTKSKVKWSTSNKKIATVKNGKITAKKAGKATITAKVNGVTLKCNIKVENPVISSSKLTVVAGKSATLSVKGTTTSVKWYTSKASIATVKNGKITAKKAGTVTISAKANGTTVKCTVKVVKPVISKTKLSLVVGKTATVKITGTSSKVTWSSSKTSVATVKSGKITARKKGTATISAKVNGVTLKCKVTVVSKPTINKTSVSIVAGNSTTLKVNGATSTVAWGSNNASVATVKDGVVFAKAKGTATISAKVSGVTLNCKVTVTAKPVVPTPEPSTEVTDTENMEVPIPTPSTEVTDTENTEVPTPTPVEKIYSLSDTNVTWNFDDGDVYLQLFLDGVDGTETINWSSSNTDIVVVQDYSSYAYVYRGSCGGVATVTVSVDGKTYSCKITSYLMQEDTYNGLEEGTIFAYEDYKTDIESRLKTSLTWDWDGDNIIQKKTTRDGSETNYIIEGTETIKITGTSEDGYTKGVLNVSTQGVYIDKEGTYNDILTNEVYELLYSEEFTRNPDYIPSDQLDFLLQTADRWYAGEISERTRINLFRYTPFNNSAEYYDYYGKRAYFFGFESNKIELNECFTAQNIADGVNEYFGRTSWTKLLLYIKVHVDGDKTYVYLVSE